jgi:hypothetical protein
MKTLVLGAAYGYRPVDLFPFVVSLRRHYDGDVLFITDKLDQEFVEFYNNYNIITFEIDNVLADRWNMQFERFNLYQQILEEHFTDTERILLTDTRDVVFQDNPFRYTPVAELEFFHEPQLYSKCNCNSNWIRERYGNDEYEKLKEQWIICSGTTMGSRQGIMSYIEEMIKEINNQPDELQILDQPVHAHLIYQGTFPDYHLYHNGEGPISTLHHQMTLSINRQGQLLNKDGSVIPVLHQWDRMGRLKYIFEETAINGPGPAPEV